MHRAKTLSLLVLAFFGAACVSKPVFAVVVDQANNQVQEIAGPMVAKP